MMGGDVTVTSEPVGGRSRTPRARQTREHARSIGVRSNGRGVVDPTDGDRVDRMPLTGDSSRVLGPISFRVCRVAFLRVARAGGRASSGRSLPSAASAGDHFLFVPCRKTQLGKWIVRG